jgi:dipeptidase D
MSKAIEGLKPELVWKRFAEISRIPRCSRKETAAAKYVLDAAKSLGLLSKTDACGNVLVKKPASKGREGVRSVALQGHLDMVCEKNKDTVHDFNKDPIVLVRQGNMLMAQGTTLGADNGIAVAANLAIMEDRSIEHGPLELLFTVDEETGLTGASNLASDFFESRTLLNLDSEEEGAIYVGCSGGKDTIGEWAIQYEDAPDQTLAVQLKITGLKGGHSGLEIDRGRGNAIKILNRFLRMLDSVGARVASIEGGDKHNAIPRECEAILMTPRRSLEQAKQKVRDLEAIVKSEMAVVEPDLAIGFSELGRRKPRVLRKADQRKILASISALSHGVIKMSADLPGLVETSTNLAAVRTTKKAMRIATSQRSSVASELIEIADAASSVFVLGGASVETSDSYPGWKPNMDSSILKIAREAYRSLYGKDPAVKAIHAGLECGVIGERISGMDMISFGPTLEGAHSPDERMHIDTVEKFWNFLLEILHRVD